MEIILNNRNESIDRNGVTVQELLDIKGYTFKMIVVKINGVLVKKTEYNEAKIKDGDNVSMIHLISGG